MNNSRRKRINESISLLEDAQQKLKVVLDEEQDALSSLPDDEEYDDMRDGMDNLISELDDTITSLEEALDTLNGADF
jgi:soluble cytochrome b562